MLHLDTYNILKILGKLMEGELFAFIILWHYVLQNKSKILMISIHKIIALRFKFGNKVPKRSLHLLCVQFLEIFEDYKYYIMYKPHIYWKAIIKLFLVSVLFSDECSMLGQA